VGVVVQQRAQISGACGGCGRLAEKIRHGRQFGKQSIN
jgi:hypothetical protein